MIERCSKDVSWMYDSGLQVVTKMLLKCRHFDGIIALPNWYKMKKVQGGMFRRVPEGEKYKIGTSNGEKME